MPGVSASDPMRALFDVTVVVPIFNECENVERCCRAVMDALNASGYSYEIIFVDDGSMDGSTEILRRLHQADARVQFIRVVRNAGQQRALAVGLRHARGQAVVTFDGDLQYEPECIVEFTKTVLSGVELVSGIRSFRRDSWMARWPSRVGNALINRFLNIHQQDFGSVKGYSRELVAAILEREHQLLCIPAMAWMLAERAVEIPITHQPRLQGESKWATLQRVQLFLDVIATYGRRPFQWLVVLGLLSLAVGIALGTGLLVYRALWPDRVISGVLIFFDLFTVFTGVNFVVLAYIGEFVIRGYRESLRAMPSRIMEVCRHTVETRNP